jgi:hypothetical protein
MLYAADSIGMRVKSVTNSDVVMPKHGTIIELGHDDKTGEATFKIEFTDGTFGYACAERPLEESGFVLRA